MLSRVQNFLPQLAEANSKLTEQLKTQPATDFDIEAVAETGPYIEMARHNSYHGHVKLEFTSLLFLGPCFGYYRGEEALG